MLVGASTVGVALISAAAAIFGALTGATSSYLLERSRQKSAREAADKAERALMHGVARLWRKRLCDFHLRLCEVLHDMSMRQRPRWWIDPHDVETEMSVDDMKRVAAAATADQWQQIDYALTHVQTIRARRAASESGGPEPSVSEMQEALHRIEEAARALADLSDDQEPTFSWKRRFRLPPAS